MIDYQQLLQLSALHQNRVRLGPKRAPQAQERRPESPYTGKKAPKSAEEAQAQHEGRRP